VLYIPYRNVKHTLSILLSYNSSAVFFIYFNSQFEICVYMTLVIIFLCLIPAIPNFQLPVSEIKVNDFQVKSKFWKSDNVTKRGIYWAFKVLLKKNKMMMLTLIYFILTFYLALAGLNSQKSFLSSFINS